MKITALRVKNFKGIKSAEIDISGPLILTGPNGAGKSTLLDAHRVLWCGQCYDANGKRVPNEALIGPHGKQAVIEEDVELGDREPFTLQWILKGGSATLTAKDARAYDVFENCKTASAIREALYYELGLEAKHLECAANPRAFLLGPELGNILAELCVGEVTTIELQDHCGEKWDMLAPMWKAGDVSALGDACYAKRTQIKKRIADLKAQNEAIGIIKPVLDKGGNPISYMRCNEIADALKGLKTKRDDLLQKKGKASAVATDSRGSIEAQLQKAKEDYERYSKEYEDLKPEAEADKEALDKSEAALHQAEEELRVAESRAEEIGAIIAAVLATKTKAGTKCPTCRQEISEEHVEALREIETKLSNEAKSCEKIYSKTKEADQKTEANSKDLQVKWSTAALNKDNSAKIAHGLEKQLKELPEAAAPIDTSTIDAEIEALDARIASGEEKVAALRDIEKRAEIQKVSEEEEASLEVVDWAVKQFRDGEFIKQRLESNSEVFTRACNKQLEAHGYSIELEVSGKSVTVLLRRGEEIAVPIQQCSKAEIVLAGWAVSQAFSDTAPVCLDDMDAMASQTKSTFLSELRERSHQGPVFIAGAWSVGKKNLEPLVKYLGEATVVWVDGGQA